MDFCLTVVAALFTLFAAASCAPAGLQDACEDVRSSSLELNHIAKTVSVEARGASRDMAGFSTSLVWMEAKDMCDPGTLKQKSMPCVEKILSVLKSYNSAVKRVSGFQSCSEFVSKVEPALGKLHKNMTKCVKSLGGQETGDTEDSIQPIEPWQEALLCRYTMDRLFSFSILAARVFAVGDPAHHAESSAQKCM